MELRLSDSGEGELAAYVLSKALSSVVISCPELMKGGIYTISAGDSHTEGMPEELRQEKSFNKQK